MAASRLCRDEVRPPHHWLLPTPAIPRKPFRETRRDSRAAWSARAARRLRLPVPGNSPPRRNTRDQFRRARPRVRPLRAPHSRRRDTVPSTHAHLRVSQTPRDTPPLPASPVGCHSTTPVLLPRARDLSSAPRATAAAPVTQPLLAAHRVPWKSCWQSFENQCWISRQQPHSLVRLARARCWPGFGSRIFLHGSKATGRGPRLLPALPAGSPESARLSTRTNRAACSAHLQETRDHAELADRFASHFPFRHGLWLHHDTLAHRAEMRFGVGADVGEAGGIGHAGGLAGFGIGPALAVLEFYGVIVEELIDRHGRQHQRRLRSAAL